MTLTNASSKFESSMLLGSTSNLSVCIIAKSDGVKLLFISAIIAFTIVSSTLAMPQPIVALPCGSKSTNKTFLFFSANAAAKFIDVVVFPTPPFCVDTAITFISFSSIYK